MGGSRAQFSAKPDGRLPLGRQCGCRNKAFADRVEEARMHPEELMKPDLLSEIVLLTFGTLMLSSLVLFIVAVLDRA